MKISHLGAKDCVTGSCHLIQTRTDSPDSVNILVDRGTASGDDPVLPFARFPVPPEKIDYLFLTHAHIDHIGRVPDLIDVGFEGEIICTHATRALLLPMLRDAMTFSDQRQQNDFRDQRGLNFFRSSSRKSFCPRNEGLETRIDDLSWGFKLYETFTLKQKITFQLSNTGHILDACFTLFTFPDNQGSQGTEFFSRLLAKIILSPDTSSGDLDCTDTPILPDLDPPDSYDLLILESTCGDRNHPSSKGRVEALRKLLEKALADKGIVYIPAFALGMTQELLYELDRIDSKVPVFVDSPLGLEITKIYSDLEDFWDKEAKDLKAKGNHPFDFKGLYAAAKYQDHQKLLNIKGPAIIIAGSGMCTGGRIVAHLKHGLDDPKNDIFFVGYQAKGTPGRRMIEKKIPVKAGSIPLPPIQRMPISGCLSIGFMQCLNRRRKSAWCMGKLILGGPLPWRWGFYPNPYLMNSMIIDSVQNELH